MTRDLTRGSPMGLILRFTFPILLGMLFQQCYNLTDAMIVGKLLGARALAAVGATNAIHFCVLGFCIGVCSGFAIPVAQQTGAKDESRMRRYTANAAWLSVLFAAGMTACTCLGSRTILRLMRTPADIFEQANEYIFILFLGIPAAFLYNLLAGVLRSLGDSRSPVYFLALSSGLNIVLDLVLILFFRTGVAGAAVATVISQGVSGLACLVYMRRRFPILRMTAEERKPDLRFCGTLCMMGIPMGLQYSITAIGSILLQSSVNALGSIYVTAVATGGKLYQLLACPFDAMGAAMATYCGQNVGAGRLDRLGKGICSCALLGFCWSLLAFGSMLLFARQGIMLFLDPGEAELELLLSLTERFILITVAFFFPLALVNICRFSIQGMGFSPFAILAGVLEMVARSAVGLWVVPAMGFTASCFGSPAAWICADLFLVPASAGCIAHLRKNASAREELTAPGRTRGWRSGRRPAPNTAPALRPGRT